MDPSRIAAFDLFADLPPAELDELATVMTEVEVDAGASKLVLIHVPPNADEAALHREAAAVHGDVTVATDLLDLLTL